MAYYGNAYNSNYQPFYPQYQPQQLQQVQQPQQIQNGGFVSVPNIDVARNYHVAPGTSVTFIDENAPYVYTKTMGFSPLDRPVFEKFKLVKEEDAPVSTQNASESNFAGDSRKNTDYALKADLEAIRGQYEALKEKVDNLLAELGGKNDE